MQTIDKVIHMYEIDSVLKKAIRVFSIELKDFNREPNPTNWIQRKKQIKDSYKNFMELLTELRGENYAENAGNLSMLDVIFDRILKGFENPIDDLLFVDILETITKNTRLK